MDKQSSGVGRQHNGQVWVDQNNQQMHRTLQGFITSIITSANQYDDKDKNHNHNKMITKNQLYRNCVKFQWTNYTVICNFSLWLFLSQLWFVIYNWQWQPTNCTGPIKLTCTKFLVDNRSVVFIIIVITIIITIVIIRLLYITINLINMTTNSGTRCTARKGTLSSQNRPPRTTPWSSRACQCLMIMLLWYWGWW